ncbi:M56 family metallopeptidase [Fulvivirgaceae bacterium BMA10]|uniref:M56 family metallopeptidase n=1 Tax=Splendidivirga corallicola TaxID=3051826 RepID=A0ABT8KZQ4_9BACT|nr:M56 family metallopeptidase [Fulvivirgaceae bacterium BMA10]
MFVSQPFLGKVIYGNIVLLPEAIANGLVSTEDKVYSIFTPQNLLLGTYIVGAGFFTMRFALQVTQIAKLIHKNKQHRSQWQGCHLIETNGKLPTFSFFRYLFWDNSLPFEDLEKDQILKHELVHIHQKHSLDIIYFELLNILLWFNPVIYLFRSAAADNHEFIADKTVSRFSTKKLYARLMVRQLFGSMNLSLVSHFNKSQVKKRLEMMKLSGKKTQLWKLLLAAPLALMLFTLFAFDVTEDRLTDFNYSNGPKDNAVETSGPVLPNSVEIPLNSNSSSNEIFTIVEEPPSPEGGMKAFYEYVHQNIRYPGDQQEKIEGKVFVQFVINERGQVTEAKVAKGLEERFDKEALRIINNSPLWKPGKQKGLPAKVRMIIPITFKPDS